MNNIKYFAFVMVLLFASCDGDQFSQIRTIELPEEEPRLAVTSRMTADSDRLTAFVSSSKPILDNSEYEEINNATVNLFKDDALFMEFTWDEALKNYSYQGAPLSLGDGTYRMEVEATGFDPIEATQKMPKACEILEVKYEEDAFVDEYGDEKDVLEVKIKDDGSEENYYSMFVKAYGKDPAGNAIEMEAYGWIEDPLMEYGWDEVFVPDLTFDGGNYVFRYFMSEFWQYEFQVDQGGEIEKLEVVINSFSKDFYRHDVSRVTYEDSQDIPFIEPVLVTSNWDKGYGIFSLQNVTRQDYEF